MKNIKYLILTITSYFLISCGASDFVPKPRGLNHIELPDNDYQSLKVDSLPYTFDFSKAARVVSSSKNKQLIQYPELGATIWLTYHPIKNDPNELDELVFTTYKILQKHNVKADGISNDSIITKNGKRGIIFTLKGEISSQYQFYTQDTTTNFIRGALYFQTAKMNDSLAPIIEFVRKDIDELVNTLEWNQ